MPRERRRPSGAIERALARDTDALVAVSPEVRDELVEIGVAPASRFAVVRLGIELSERMAGLRGGAAPRVARDPPERFRIGWVARMTAVKQPGDVLRTVRLLRDRGVDAALVVVGDGPDRARLEEQARELGLDRGRPLRRLPERRRPVVPRVRRPAPAVAQRGNAGERDRDAGRRDGRSSRRTSAGRATSSRTASPASSCRSATSQRVPSGSSSSRATRRCASAWERPARRAPWRATGCRGSSRTSTGSTARCCRQKGLTVAAGG